VLRTVGQAVATGHMREHAMAASDYVIKVVNLPMFKICEIILTSSNWRIVGVIFGGSAGAIIFGRDLEACQLDDVNEVNLNETNGFDILNGISILCHYTNRTIEKDEKSKQYLLGVSKYRRVVALPEEVTLFVNCGNIEVIGNRPYYFFEKGVITKCFSGTDLFGGISIY